MDEQKIAEYIFNNGKQYKPALCPPDVMRGGVGDCFDTCLANAVFQGFGYVEGLAKHPKKDEWILHAWLTDGEHAFDPTWRAFTDDNEEKPVPTFYVGIELDVQKVVDFVHATGYKSVIANFERNAEVAQKALPAGFPRKTTSYTRV